MKNVNIIYDKYIDDDFNVTIGGIQTYITDLSNVIVEMGMTVQIVQFAKKRYEYLLSNGVTIHGVPNIRSNSKKKYQKLYNYSKGLYQNNSITIFATNTIIPNNIESNCIAIQHGIWWDIQSQTKRSLVRQIFSKALLAYRTVKKLTKVNSVICVDRNFINWYRTQSYYSKLNYIAIPNYTIISPRVTKSEDKVNIIFARRLFEYRGTRIFTSAIIKILDEYLNVSVTIAGTGPDEKYMRKKLNNYQNVNFIKYSSYESRSIHSNMHIAVVPTVGSEGTSLSLLEAMSSQCAVVCSDIGGMTNVVIDGFNGKMVPAGNVESLYKALKYLIDNPKETHRLANMGYETVKQGFSYESWKKKWIVVIENILKS